MTLCVSDLAHAGFRYSQPVFVKGVVRRFQVVSQSLK
jgi:hypothetical protein